MYIKRKQIQQIHIDLIKQHLKATIFTLPQKQFVIVFIKETNLTKICYSVGKTIWLTLLQMLISKSNCA